MKSKTEDPSESSPPDSSASDAVYVTMDIHVSDSRKAQKLYQEAFGLDILTSDGSFFDADIVWGESELEMPNGLITVRFIEDIEKNGPFPPSKKIVFVKSDLDEVQAKAQSVGFIVNRPIQSWDDGLQLLRLVDPEGNQIMVTNRNTWKKSSIEAQNDPR